MVGCFLFGILGFIEVMAIQHILGYCLLSILMAYLLSAEVVRDNVADAFLNAVAKDSES